LLLRTYAIYNIFRTYSHFILIFYAKLSEFTDNFQYNLTFYDKNLKFGLISFPMQKFFLEIYIKNKIKILLMLQVFPLLLSPQSE